MEIRFKDYIYDPDTGEFRWADTFEKPHYKKIPGKLAGSHDSNGYLQIRVDGRIKQAHRVAWYIMTGEWPGGQIDHINRNILDNRFKNFRVVSNRVNARNRKDNQKFPGVRFFRGKYQARIKINYKENNLGYFKTEEEAIEAYLNKFKELELGELG